MTSDGVAGGDEPIERGDELRDVGEVQAGGRLVEQEQRAAPSAPASASSAASFSRCASPPDSVGTAWPRAR